MVGKRAKGNLKLIRPHVVGRNIDEVARKENAGQYALDLAVFRILRNKELCPVRLGGLVFVESVAAETETESEAIGRQGCGLDVPLAFRQFTGEFPGDEGDFRGIAAKAEKHAAQRTIGGRNEQDGACLRLEPRLLRPVQSDRIDGALFDMGRRDGENRQCAAGLGAERGRAFDELIGRHCMLP